MSFTEKLKAWLNCEDYDDDCLIDRMSVPERELEPVTLVQNAVGAVAADAKEWPDGVDLPDTLEIWISLADYEYFGPRKASCEKRIADAIVRYAEQAHALLECEPTVILRTDPAFTRGQMRTKTHFSNPDDPLSAPLRYDAEPPKGGVKTQLFQPDLRVPSFERENAVIGSVTNWGNAGEGHMPNTSGANGATGAGVNGAVPQGGVKPKAKEKEAPCMVSKGSPRDAAAAAARPDEPAAATDPAPATQPAPESAPDPAPAPHAAGTATPTFKPAGELHALTPELKPVWMPASPMAKLIDRERQIDVLDGDTVGCLRQLGEPAPAIALDETDYPYVSQQQASFSCNDQGTWHLTSLGRNGTAVQREGVWTELEKNKPFELRDGDRISFARSAPLTFSLS